MKLDRRDAPAAVGTPCRGRGRTTAAAPAPAAVTHGDEGGRRRRLLPQRGEGRGGNVLLQRDVPLRRILVPLLGERNVRAGHALVPIVEQKPPLGRVWRGRTDIARAASSSCCVRGPRRVCVGLRRELFTLVLPARPYRA